MYRLIISNPHLYPNLITEQEGAPVPSGSNVGFGELTEKEVVVGEEDQDEFAPDDNPQSIKQPANPQSINQPANPQSINQPANPPTILEAKLGKKKLKKFKDGWIVNTEKIQARTFRFQYCND